jgi:serine/threonine protein kinase
MTSKGGFGFVDLVTEVHTKKDYVLKRCNVDREVAFATVKKEINILQRFAGPYMVELIDSDIITKNRTSREALLLLDFCPGGHLLERLNSRNGNPLPAESVFRIFGQLLLALKPLHENRPPVVHRDLKLENILFGAVSCVSD